MTLCCLAPLINISLALAKEPRLAAYLREIVLIRGSFGEGGNITPTAEFNVFVHPEAAKRVLQCRAPITMIPLDCTDQALTTKVRLKKLRMLSTPLAEAFFHLPTFNKIFDEQKYQWDGGLLHDATVIAYLRDPTIFSGHRVPVSVECNSQLTPGMTVVGWWSVTNQDPDVLFLRGIDTEQYFDLVIERLGRL